MFQACPKQLTGLLAAATPAVQHGHALCLPRARTAIRAVLLVAARLMHRWLANAHSVDAQPRRVALQTPHAVLPYLPDELWFCILGLIRWHELGGANH